MKFVDKEKIYKIVISGTEVQTRALSISAQFDYLMLIGDDSLKPEDKDNKRLMAEKFREKIVAYKDDLDNIFATYIVKIGDQPDVKKALQDIASLNDYIELIDKIYTLSTVGPDEAKN